MLIDEKQLLPLQKQPHTSFLDTLKKHFFKPQTSSYLILLGLALTIINLFTLKTLLSLSLIFLGVYLKFCSVIEKFLSRGLMSYLPQSTQTILTTRSIFDILCDFWYIVRIQSYFKVFFRPFFLKIEPEQAITNLNELHPSIKQVILRKGIINNFPDWFKRLIFPSQNPIPKYNILQELDDTYDEEEKSSTQTNNEIQMISCQSPLYQQQQQQQTEFPQLDLQKEISSCFDIKSKHQLVTESDSEQEFANLQINRGGSCNNVYQILDKKQKKQTIGEQDSESGDIINNNNSEELNTSSMPIKTRIITSSQSPAHNPQLLQKFFNNKFMRNLDVKEFSQKWDKLELFQQEKKQQQEQKKNQKENKFQIKGPIALIYSILQIKKMGLSNAIGSKDLRLIFALSSLGFLWQLYISKRVRGWTANVFVVIFYIIFFVLSTSSWILLVYKMIKSRSMTQNEIEMQREDLEIDDQQVDDDEDEQDGQDQIKKLNNEENQDDNNNNQLLLN